MNNIKYYQFAQGQTEFKNDSFTVFRVIKLDEENSLVTAKTGDSVLEFFSTHKEIEENLSNGKWVDVDFGDFLVSFFEYI